MVGVGIATVNLLRFIAACKFVAELLRTNRFGFPNVDRQTIESIKTVQRSGVKSFVFRVARMIDALVR